MVDTSAAKEFSLAHWLVGGADGGRLFVRCFDAAMNVRENIAGDVLASLTTMQWNIPSKAWIGGATMADASLNRRMTVRLLPEELRPAQHTHDTARVDAVAASHPRREAHALPHAGGGGLVRQARPGHAEALRLLVGQRQADRSRPDALPQRAEAGVEIAEGPPELVGGNRLLLALAHHGAHQRAGALHAGLCQHQLGDAAHRAAKQHATGRHRWSCSCSPHRGRRRMDSSARC